MLVATSIGEEGLDIGEVDLIICYDALGSATRTTQRYGRTGRKHDGRVVTLMTEGFEEQIFERGIERYNKMRKAIRGYAAMHGLSNRAGRMLVVCPRALKDQRACPSVVAATRGTFRCAPCRHSTRRKA